MDILFLLIPLAVALALLIGAAFWWSVRSGQFDDLDAPAHRILADDDDAVDVRQHPPEPDYVTSRLSTRGDVRP